MSLPPVPKSLGPLASSSPKGSAGRPRPLSQHRTPPKEPPPPPPPSAALHGGSATSVGVTLDAKLQILRKEMAGLRQADVQLMNQLRQLEQSIQELRNAMASSPIRHHSDWLELDGDGVDHPHQRTGNGTFYPISEEIGSRTSASSSLSFNSTNN